MEEILKLAIIGFSCLGIVLGLYGLFMPRINRLFSGFARTRTQAELDEEHIERVLARMRDDFTGAGFEPFAAPVVPRPPMQRPGFKSVAAAPIELEDDEEDADDDVLIPAERFVPEGNPLEGEDLEEEDETEQEAELVAVVAASLDEEQEAPAEAGAGAADPDDIMAFFEEESDLSNLSSGLKDAIEDVPIDQLLAEARQISQLVGNKARRAA